MKRDNEILTALLAGGLIGAALWTLLSEDKDSETGKTARTATLTTFKANKRAQQTNIPVYVEDNGNLYAITPQGEKKFIKTIKKPKIKVPESFDLI